MGQSMDQYIKQSSGVKLTNCQDSSSLLCDLCSTTDTYKVTDLSEFWIEGQLKSTCKNLQQLLKEFSSYMESDEYYVALGNLTACVSASSPSSVDFEELYSDFLSLDYHSISHPEIFEYKPVLQTIAAKANNGAGSGHYYSDLQLFYINKQYYQLNSGVNLELSYYTEYLQYQEGTVLYQGNAQLKSDLYAPFTIQIDYDRTQLQTFYVVMDVNHRYLLGEWVDSLWPEGQCSQVETPRGLNSIQKLTVPHTNIIFTQNEDEMTMQEMLSYVEVPDFAIAPGIKIHDVTGTLSIRTEDCSLDVVGKWQSYGDILELNIRTFREDHFNATAYLTNDDNSMSLKQLENIIYSLYTDAKPIIPRYNEEDSKLQQLLYTTTLIQPRLDFYFEPEISIRIQSSSSIHSKADSHLDMFIGRVEAAIETVLILSQINSDALESISSNLENIESTGLSFYSVILISSTSKIDIQTLPAYIYTSGSYPYEYEAGIYLEARIKQNKQCEYNELCSIYGTNSQKPKEAVVKTEYYPTRFIFSGDVGEITLTKHIQLVNNSIKIPLEPDQSVYISGNFDIQGDSSDNLRFACNITHVSGDAYMTGRLKNQWHSAFDIENLEVFSLTLHANVNGEGDVEKSSMKGYASLGCQETSNAWPGEIVASLSPSNYTLNYFTMELKSNDYKDSLCAISNITEPSNLASALDFPAGATLNYAYEDHDSMKSGFSLSANVLYLDIPSSLQHSTSQVNSTFYASMKLPDFTMGYGNIKVNADEVGNVLSSLYAEQNRTYGYINGNVSMFGMQDRMNLHLDDSLFWFEISGYPYGGIFDMGFNVTAEFNKKLDTALFSLNGMLSLANVTKLENDTRTNLVNWISSGITVLDEIEAQINIQNLTVTSLQKDLCIDPCPTRSTCIQKPIKKCIEYAVTTQCIANKTGCASIDLSCTEELTVCESYSTRCISYDKKLPNVCSEYETICETYQTVCKEYSSNCTNYIEGGCSAYEYIEHEEDCLNYEFTCENQDIEDVSCRSKCEHNEDKYENAVKELEKLKLLYRDTVDDLGAFRYLKYMTTEDLFSLVTHALYLEISSSGIGPRDMNIHFVYEIPDLEVMEGVNEESTIAWNFFDYVEVLNSLTQQVKEDIIKHCKTKQMSDDLSTKQPREVAYENIY